MALMSTYTNFTPAGGNKYMTYEDPAVLEAKRKEIAKQEAQKKLSQGTVLGSSITMAKNTPTAGIVDNQMAMLNQIVQGLTKPRDDAASAAEKALNDQIASEQRALDEIARALTERQGQLKGLYSLKRDETGATYDTAIGDIQRTRDTRATEYADAQKKLEQTRDKDVNSQQQLYGRLGIAESSQFMNKDTELRGKYADQIGSLTKEEQNLFNELDSKRGDLEKEKTREISKLQLQEAIELEDLASKSFESKEAKLAAISQTRQKYSDYINQINNSYTNNINNLEMQKAQLLDTVAQYKLKGQGSAQKYANKALQLTQDQMDVLSGIAKGGASGELTPAQLALLASAGVDQNSEGYKNFSLQQQAATGTAGTFQDYINQLTSGVARNQSAYSAPLDLSTLGGGNAAGTITGTTNLDAVRSNLGL